MDIQYVDMVTVEFLSSIKVANIVPRYWSVGSYGRSLEEYIVKPLSMGDINTLASLEKHFIRVCENISQHPVFYIPFGP